MNHDLPVHKKGDTFNGSSFTVTVNGEPLNLTNASIKMQLKTTKNSNTSAMDFTTANNKIVITYPTLGKFQIPPQIININAGLYYYDIQITLSTGIIKTYIEGQWKFEQDVTV